MNGTTGRHGPPRQRSRRPAGVLAAAAAGVAVLVAACGSGRSSPAGSYPSHPPGYGQYHAYSQCMRSHGAPDYPILGRGPGGSLVHPLSPPAGMLSSPGYDAAFRARLPLAVTSGRDAARYRAAALKGLKQAECMRAHEVTGYPSPAALDGGLHVPDFTAIGFDPHTLRFQAAGRACGMGDRWPVLWSWPAGLTQQSPTRLARQ